jgi:hypothetical protein
MASTAVPMLDLRIHSRTAMFTATPLSGRSSTTFWDGVISAGNRLAGRITSRANSPGPLCAELEIVCFPNADRNASRAHFPLSRWKVSTVFGHRSPIRNDSCDLQTHIHGRILRYDIDNSQLVFLTELETRNLGRPAPIEPNRRFTGPCSADYQRAVGFRIKALSRRQHDERTITSRS